MPTFQQQPTLRAHSKEFTHYFNSIILPQQKLPRNSSKLAKKSVKP
jgi:hypothetical protein